MIHRIRRAIVGDRAFLVEMLYESLFVPLGQEALPKGIIENPVLARYVRGFGDERGDVGFIAEDASGVRIGATWIRQMTSDDPGYGFVDDETPELSIAVVAKHRGIGVGSDLLNPLLAETPRCSLSVDERNPAIRLYTRAGFRVFSRDGSSLTMLRSRE